LQKLKRLLPKSLIISIGLGEKAVKVKIKKIRITPHLLKSVKKLLKKPILGDFKIKMFLPLFVGLYEPLFGFRILRTL